MTLNKNQMFLSDFEYTPDYTQDAFDDAEAFLIKGASEKLFGGTANFGLFGAEGFKREYSYNACHANVASKHTGQEKYSLIASEALFDSSNRNPSHMPYHVNGNSSDPIRRERAAGVVDGFFNWFVYESLFGRFILNRDRDSVKKGFIFSTDLPPAITQTLCIVSRHFYEVLDRAFMKFDELAAAGVPKSVAYVVAFNGYYSYSYSPREANAIYSPLYNHRVFAFPDRLSTLVNFSEGKCLRKNLKQKSHRECPSYFGCGNLFFDAYSDYLQPTHPFTYTLVRTHSELREFIKSLRNDESTTTTVINPFSFKTRAEADPLNVTNDEMFSIILFLNEQGVFKNAVH